MTIDANQIVTIQEYFKIKFARFILVNPSGFFVCVNRKCGDVRYFDILSEVPVDSGCGDDCKRLIDAWEVVLEQRLNGNADADVYEKSIVMGLYECCQVCVTFIRG
jgi:hypothetical protein